jgi:predicted membrane protein
MKRNFKSIIWGFALVLAGILFLLSNLEVLEIDFAGWWTVFIIIPCIIGLFTRGERLFSLMGIVLGVLLFLAAQEHIEYSLVWQIIVPLIIVAVGIKLIFNSKKGKKLIKKGTEIEYIGVFGGDDVKITDKFNGSSCIAVFGGIELDLSEAEITEDIEIEAIAVFGGIDIIVPKDVIIQATGTSVFGGCDNSFKNEDKKNKKTIYINYVNVFGGLDIK